MATHNSLIQFIELFPVETTPDATHDISVATDPAAKPKHIAWANEPDNWTTASPAPVVDRTHSNAQGKGKGKEERKGKGKGKNARTSTPRPAQVKSKNTEAGPNLHANTKVTIIKNTYNKESRTSGDVLMPIYAHASKPQTLEIRFDILPDIDNIKWLTIKDQNNRHDIIFPVMKQNGTDITLHQHTPESVTKLVSQIEKYIHDHNIQYVLLQYSGKDRVSYNIQKSVTEEAKEQLLLAITTSGVLEQINTALATTFFSNKASYTIYANSNTQNAIKRILKELDGKAGAQASPESAGPSAPVVNSNAQTNKRNPTGKPSSNRTKKATGQNNNVLSTLPLENKAKYEASIEIVKRKNTPANNADRQKALNTLDSLGKSYPALVKYSANTYSVSIRGWGRGPGSGRGNSSTGRGRRVVPAGIISKVTICKNTIITGSKDTYTKEVFKALSAKSHNKLCIVFGKKTDNLIKDATAQTPYIQYTIPLYTIKDDNTIDAIEYTQTTLNTLFTDLAKYIADNNVGFVLIPYTGNTYITVFTEFGKLAQANKHTLLDTFRNKAIDGKTIYSMINEAIYYTFDNHPNNYDIVYNPEDSASMHIEYNKKFIESPSTTQTEIKPSNMSHANNAVNAETKKEYYEILNKLVNLNKADNGYNTIRADLERKLTDILKDPVLLKFHKDKFNIKDTNTLIPANVSWADLED